MNDKFKVERLCLPPGVGGSWTEGPIPGEMVWDENPKDMINQKYVFADLEDIRKSTKVYRDLRYDLVLYTYSSSKGFKTNPNSIRVAMIVDKDDAVRYGRDVYTYVVKALAEKYDEAMIKEVFHMSGTAFEEIRNYMSLIGGSLEVNYEKYVLPNGSKILADGPVVTLKLPATKLKCIQLNPQPFDGDSMLPVSEACIRLNPKLPKISNIEVHNDRVVIVRFADGTYSKSVCSPDDTFNLDTGIAYCLMKRLLGQDGHRKFNDLLRSAHKVIEDKEKAFIQKQEEERKRAAIEIKRRGKKIRKAAAKREEMVSIIQEAMRRDRTDQMYDGKMSGTYVDSDSSLPIINDNHNYSEEAMG